MHELPPHGLFKKNDAMIENSIAHVAICVNVIILVYVIYHAKDIEEIIRDWKNRKRK